MKNYKLTFLLGLASLFIAAQTPELVADINPSGSSTPSNLKVIGDKLYFRAENGVNGLELWEYDKVNATMVTDLYPGADGSISYEYTEFNGDLYFIATEPVHGQELYKYDGTSVSLVYDINPGTSGASLDDFCVSGGVLYFEATDGVHGREPWKYDGVNNPEMVADINPGSASSYPADFIDLNGTVFFVADEPVHGEELWSYDGSDTTVYDIAVGGTDSDPDELYVWNNALFFEADDDVHDTELWKFENGAVSMVIETNPSGSIFLLNMAGTSNALYFIAWNDVWKYDGDTAIHLSDTSTDRIDKVVVYNDEFYFEATTPDNGNELWKTDGSTVELVADVNPGTGDSGPHNLRQIGNYLYFNADDDVHGRELRRYDGSSVEVIDINPGAGSSSVNWLTEFDGTLYLAANDGVNGNELFRIKKDVVTSIAELTSDVVLFPNPSSTMVTIKTTQEVQQITLVDQQGKTVSTSTASQFNIEALSTGVYFVNIQYVSGVSEVKKMIKK